MCKRMLLLVSLGVTWNLCSINADMLKTAYMMTDMMIH